MVQRVFDKIGCIPADVDVTIATSVNQEVSIRSQLKGDYSLVLEPERRDTAPAIMLAAAYLAYDREMDLQDPVVVMPIDSYADQEYYDKAMELARVVECDGGLALLGVTPTYPSEKYGYIVPGGKRSANGVFPVEEFREKPDEETARSLIARGALWNCGVFAFSLGYLTSVLEKYNPSKSYQAVLENYSDLPKNSFDYEVVEKADKILVVPYKGAWKDLGTGNTLTEEMRDPVQGRAVASAVSNVHIINETGLPMVVAGLRDAVVVATHDGILACSKEASTGIKKLVEAVGESRPMYEKRRWGEYRVIDSRVYGNGRSALTKELVVAPGKQLSYQRHAHRSEVWTIVSGEGEIVLDGHVTPVVPGAVLDIRPMQMHAIRAFSDLHIIEVQLGSPLIEEDIERFGNYWREPFDEGRA